MSNLESISQIWNTIVQSNTFNFIVFVAIIAFVFKKIDIQSMITALQTKIIKTLEDAKKEKEAALFLLTNAQKAVENLGEELKTIEQDAQNGAEILGAKVLEEASKQIESIEQNAKRVIEAEEKLLISKLTKSTSRASVEVAKNHVQNVLKETPTLHEKYINDSIDELDRLNF